MTSRLTPIHPGQMLLRQFLEPLDLSQNKLARELDVSAPRVNAIINNKRRITPDMALRLSRYFGNSAEFWLNIQQRYDLERTEDEIGAEINRRIAPRSPKELATV